MRQNNPAVRNLSWVAAEFAPEVFFGVVAAFGEATGLHDLRDQAQRALVGNDFRTPLKAVMHGNYALNDPRVAKRVQSLLRETKRQLKRSENQAYRSGNTKFDKSLPWLAKQMEVVLLHQIETRDWDYRRAWAQAHGWEGTLPDVEDVNHLLIEVVDVLNKQRRLPPLSAYFVSMWPTMRYGWRVHPPSHHEHVMSLIFSARSAPGAFERAIDPMVTSFGMIASWAHDSETELKPPYNFDRALGEATAYYGSAADFEVTQLAKGPTGERVYEWPDGWHIVELRTRRDLNVEGRLLRNCIEGYTPSRLLHNGGNVQVFSLRTPRGRPVAAAQWNIDGYFDDVKGFANSPTRLAQTARLLEFRDVFPFDGQFKLERVPCPRKPEETCLVAKSKKWKGRFKLDDGDEVDLFIDHDWHSNEPELYLSKEVDLDFDYLMTAVDQLDQAILEHESRMDDEDEDDVFHLDVLREERQDSDFEPSEYLPGDFYNYPDTMGESRPQPRSFRWADGAEEGAAWAYYKTEKDPAARNQISTDDELVQWSTEWFDADYDLVVHDEQGNMIPGLVKVTGKGDGGRPEVDFIDVYTGDRLPMWNERMVRQIDSMIASNQARQVESLKPGIHRLYPKRGRMTVSRQK